MSKSTITGAVKAIPDSVNDNYQNPSMADNDNSQIVVLLENQIADLSAQLAQASDLATALVSEKSKRLEMLPADNAAESRKETQLAS